MKIIFLLVMCIFILSQLVSEPIDPNQSGKNQSYSPIHQVYFNTTELINQESESNLNEHVAINRSPILTVNPTNIDIGILHPDEPFSERFVVSNDGSGTLSGTISADTSWINSIIPSLFELDQDENTVVRISGNIPATQNEYEAYIFVDSNSSSDTVYVHGWSTNTAGLIFTFANHEFTTVNDSLFLDYDIMIQTSGNGIRLGSAMVYVLYNYNAFGKNIYLNGNLTITKGDVLLGQLGGVDLYDIINIFDTDSSKFAVTTEFNSSFPETFANEIPDTLIQYLHVSMTCFDESEYSQLSFDNDLMEGQQYFADNTTIFYPVIAHDSLNVIPSPPETPGNVNIMIDNSTLSLTWDPVIGATSYTVYSSEDPYSAFTEDTSGSFYGETWTTSIVNVKKFYYVTALN